jgi:excisionase family DNA binding protein
MSKGAGRKSRSAKAVLCRCNGSFPEGWLSPEGYPNKLKMLDSFGIPLFLGTPNTVGGGIGRSTVYQLVKEGKLACIQVTSRNRRFTKEMVEEFIKSQTVRRHWFREVDFLDAARITH